MDFDKELHELAANPDKVTRLNGGHAVVTPRIEPDPQRYDFARLGETVAESLVQTAQEQANRANVMLEQARDLAANIRFQVAEKNRELAEMNKQLTAFGEKVLTAARDG